MEPPHVVFIKYNHYLFLSKSYSHSLWIVIHAILPLFRSSHACPTEMCSFAPPSHPPPPAVTRIFYFPDPPTGNFTTTTTLGVETYGSEALVEPAELVVGQPASLRLLVTHAEAVLSQTLVEADDHLELTVGVARVREENLYATAPCSGGVTIACIRSSQNHHKVIKWLTHSHHMTITKVRIVVTTTS